MYKRQILRLSDDQVEVLLLDDLDSYNTPIYYGLYLPKEYSDYQNIKVGHLSSISYIDTLIDNKVYYHEDMYLKMYQGSYEFCVKNVYNANPPYQLVNEEVKVLQHGNSIKSVTNRVGSQYITTTSNGVDILDIDSNNVTISDYGLRDYFATSLLNNKGDIIKSYSLSDGIESIDSTIVIKVQNHFVNGKKMKSYTIRMYNSLDNYKHYSQIIGINFLDNH